MVRTAHPSGVGFCRVRHAHRQQRGGFAGCAMRTANSGAVLQGAPCAPSTAGWFCRVRHAHRQQRGGFVGCAMRTVNSGAVLQGAPCAPPTIHQICVRQYAAPPRHPNRPDTRRHSHTGGRSSTANPPHATHIRASPDSSAGNPGIAPGHADHEYNAPRNAAATICLHCVCVVTTWQRHNHGR